jgi:excisionase family DNA binding protein
MIMTRITSKPPEVRLAYRPDDAARAAGLGRVTIFAAIKRGELRARKVGRATIITADDLQRWIDALPARQVA